MFKRGQNGNFSFIFFIVQKKRPMLPQQFVDFMDLKRARVDDEAEEGGGDEDDETEQDEGRDSLDTAKVGALNLAPDVDSYEPEVSSAEHQRQHMDMINKQFQHELAAKREQAAREQQYHAQQHQLEMLSRKKIYAKESWPGRNSAVEPMIKPRHVAPPQPSPAKPASHLPIANPPPPMTTPKVPQTAASAAPSKRLHI